MIIIVMVVSLRKLRECHYAEVVIIMMMISIEKSSLATRLKKCGGDSHVHGLDVLAGVGCWMV